MTVAFRLANPDLRELTKLAALRWEFFIEDGGAPSMQEAEFIDKCSAFLLKELEAQRWFYWLALSEDKIVSLMFVQKIRMVPKPSRINDEYGYLTNVYTVPEFRNKGIGAQLMNTVIEWAKTIDLELLVVWPSDESRNFYQRAGFTADNQVMELVFR